MIDASAAPSQGDSITDWPASVRGRCSAGFQSGLRPQRVIFSPKNLKAAPHLAAGLASKLIQIQPLGVSQPLAEKRKSALVAEPLVDGIDRPSALKPSERSAQSRQENDR